MAEDLRDVPFVGLVLRRTLRVVAANWLPMLVVAAVVDFPLFALNSRLSAAAGSGSSLPDAWYFAAWVLQVVLTLTAAGLGAHAVVDTLSDGRADWEASLARTAPELPVGFLVVLAVGGAIALGMPLLLVPGLYVAVHYGMAVPASMVEGTSFVGALRRSRALVFTRNWEVLGVILVLEGAGMLVTAPIPWLAHGAVPATLATSAVDLARTVFEAAAIGVTYHALRELEGDFGVAQVARRFE